MTTCFFTCIRMCTQLLFVLFVLSDVQITKSQESAQYLQTAMWSLENRMNPVHSKRRLDSLQMKISGPALQKDDGNNNVPMLSLTKGELAALYEAAVTKQQSSTVSDSQNNPLIQAVINELNEEAKHSQQTKDSDNTSGDDSGYYYYYYPVNSFMDGMSTTPDHIATESHHTHHTVEDDKVHAQYHSHTHQHNVHITSTKGSPDHDKKKIMEPLFMAVSSFVGMAVMFILSILFLPKFGAPKSRGVKQTHAGEITTLAQIIFKAIEGDDCSERVVCELGKAAKALNVYDNRFVKLFRRVTPAYVGWYVDGIGKYAHTNLTCASIQCRRKNTSKSKLSHKKYLK